ncbi:MAG TPA: 23S rRNA (adenine(2503)-C(2))-methyltransferase RlmN, partial [Polyangiales bacterium]|nr:23S rRNA (adenine(2503)-C(2))-methyltransferase RlmN [Polyangiales bacterium]
LRPVFSLPLAERAPAEPPRVSRAQAFGLLPEELGALSVPAPEATFERLQRPWLWQSGAPQSSRAARSLLESLGLSLPRIATRQASADGSTKLLLELGSDRVEAVHMPRAVAGGRVTLCISSQVGCAMGCGFCATASMGFIRQLSAGEIVAQVLACMSELGPRHPSELTLVFMGMGEPLHNLPEVLRAIRVLCHPRGLGLSARRITVSTSGLVPEIVTLGESSPRPLLALSLNATTDELRRELMPIGKRFPLALLQSTLQHFPLRPRERITIEYVLLSGVNDRPADALRLADFCAPFPHNINLIPFNEHSLAPYRAPTERDVDGFAQTLLAHRPTLVTVRRSRGRDVQGACGQLVQS